MYQKLLEICCAMRGHLPPPAKFDQGRCWRCGKFRPIVSPMARYKRGNW